MAVTDPREEFDDLLEWPTEEERLDAAAFAAHREMEAFRSGWVATGFVFDRGRLLLAYDDEAGHWLAPGGTLQPGETLEECLVREVREETGVEVTPERPHVVGETVVRHGDESASFTVVCYEATAETTAVGDDLGEDDEHIVDADWFQELPDDVYNRAGVEEVLERCERWTW